MSCLAGSSSGVACPMFPTSHVPRPVQAVPCHQRENLDDDGDGSGAKIQQRKLRRLFLCLLCRVPMPNDCLAVEGSIETSRWWIPFLLQLRLQGSPAEETTAACLPLPRRAHHAGPARQNKTAETTTNESAASVGVCQQSALI